MSTAKNQHYVPKFYLKGFCKSKDKIAVYDRNKMCIYRNANIRNFAAENKCYDIEKEQLESVLKQWIEVFPNIFGIDIYMCFAQK